MYMYVYTSIYIYIYACKYYYESFLGFFDPKPLDPKPSKVPVLRFSSS